MSDDLKKVLEATVAECTGAVATCRKTQEEMVAVNISDLITEQNEDLELLKKTFVDKLKTVVLHKGKQDKAIKALIKAAKEKNW